MQKVQEARRAWREHTDDVKTAQPNLSNFSSSPLLQKNTLKKQVRQDSSYQALPLAKSQFGQYKYKKDVEMCSDSGRNSDSEGEPMSVDHESPLILKGFNRQ